MGEYVLLVKKLKTGDEFVAFAKREPFIADAHFVNEPGEMWFEFGFTEDEALKNLKHSLLH